MVPGSHLALRTHGLRTQGKHLLGGKNTWKHLLGGKHRFHKSLLEHRENTSWGARTQGKHLLGGKQRLTNCPRTQGLRTPGKHLLGGKHRLTNPFGIARKCSRPQLRNELEVTRRCDGTVGDPPSHHDAAAWISNEPLGKRIFSIGAASGT